MELPRFVKDIMSPDPTTLQRNETLSIADTIMTLGRVRHMPVLDEQDALVGVVSQRDMFRGALANALGYGRMAQDKIMDVVKVKEVMSTELVTVNPDTPISDAARRMTEGKFGCLPVVEGGKLVGIVTESDFVAFFVNAA